jgi:acetolactate decarboxylase
MFLRITAAICFIVFSAKAQVLVIGQMRDVMWKGQLDGKIHLDTIQNKTHLYGLGPEDYLRGEIMVVDGVAYRSRVASAANMVVEETFDLKAPFFGYGWVEKWNSRVLPGKVRTIKDLENYLSGLDLKEPLFFRLKGMVKEAHIHVVNLPEGKKVSSPQEAHEGQVNYILKDREVEILGFYSKHHKAIFTHHDTDVHMHLLSADKKMMGHVDEMELGKGMELWLPRGN